MFGWSKPQCPVDEKAKCWIENGSNGFQGSSARIVQLNVLLYYQPETSFQTRWMELRRDVRNLLDQVCVFMGVDPKTVELELFTTQTNLASQ